MKAWIKRPDGLRLEEVPAPRAGADEVLVQVKAISLNRGEVRGAARAAEGVIPGWDIAGVVVEPSAKGVGPAKGARVAALLDGKGWSEFAAVSVERAAIIPDAVDFETAATLPIAGLTILRAFDVAGSLLGKHVLITGGSGGVGQLAIQLGARAGATVTTVTSKTAQHGLLRELGARNVVTTIDDAKGPFDLILESVGGRSLAAAIERVARGGVVVTIGNSSEEDTTFNARTLYAKGAAAIYGLLIFEEVASRRIGARDLERLLEMAAAGALRSSIEVRDDWTRLLPVLADLEHRSYSGKAVLTLG